MEDNVLTSWLTIIRTPGIGNKRLTKLVDLIEHPHSLVDAALSHKEQLKLSDASVQWLQQPNHQLIEQDIQWLTQQDHHLITVLSDDYPPLLREIDDCPQFLFAKGNIELLHNPQVAIVGSRTPTPQGEQNAYDFAHHLASNGITITSGLALGVDAQAHQGALKNGTTIAVTGTGLDRIYPAKNKHIAHQIARDGLLISEFPLGTPPNAGNFPRRNRIISGLSAGTLVIEARLNSGSLITARTATEQCREVFAVPGSIHNPQAKGCHQLIKQGAQLVETSEDIINQLASILGNYLPSDKSITSNNSAPSNSNDSLDPDYQILLKNMGYDPVTVNEIIERTGLSASTVSSMLLLLEMQGSVSSVPGGQYCRTGTED